MTVLAVFLGGALGTMARLGADLLAQAWGWGAGWSTLVVNVVGSFLLGLLVARLPVSAPRWLRAGVGAGLLGGFTTFSALAFAVVIHATEGAWGLVAGQTALNLILGIAAAMAGLALGPGRNRTPVVSEDE